ncbi:cell division suppressor protein YneA [Lederbergia citrea]|uniref:cell division suppressor protein YneA n=1 Tax=Lederbergia citrea TaxID=2833581 RepID=UPI001BC95775|nr:LysM peptidoglycan-binding domain-containing protein [Lederbergia citrea]MBS4177011.1 LysM peptidoglycan-binding domain-containing protein [Lederbergia citrea]MBS4203584.1 LysM peptidoglycan-binding domain-containing protein [Lederbergia citrea]
MISLWRKYSFSILFIILSLVMGLYLIFNVSEDDSTNIKITVQDGDSLWTISNAHAERFGMSTSDLVKLIQKENHLFGTTIKSGDELVIPGSYLRNNNKESELAFETN